jgi:hypothetical protein
MSRRVSGRVQAVTSCRIVHSVASVVFAFGWSQHSFMYAPTIQLRHFHPGVMSSIQQS